MSFGIEADIKIEKQFKSNITNILHAFDLLSHYINLTLHLACASLIFTMQIYFKSDIDAWYRKQVELNIDSLTNRIATIGWLYIIVSFLITTIIEASSYKLIDFKNSPNFDYVVSRIMLFSLRCMISGPQIKALTMYYEQADLDPENPWAQTVPIVMGYFFLLFGVIAVLYLVLFNLILHNKRRTLASALLFSFAIIISGLAFVTLGGHIYFADNYSFMVKKSIEKPKIIANRLGSVVGPEGSRFNIIQICSNTPIDMMELDVRITKDGDLVISREHGVGCYNDNYSTIDMISRHSLKDLQKTNIGQKWIRIDPYNVFHDPDYPADQLLKAETQTFQSAYDAITLITGRCRNENGTQSDIILDFNDNELFSVYQKIFLALISENPQVTFQIYCRSTLQFEDSKAILKRQKNVKYWLKYADDIKMNGQADYIWAPIKNLTLQDKIQKPVVIQSFASNSLAVLFWKTGIRYIATENPLNCLQGQQSVVLVGAGWFYIYLSVACLLPYLFWWFQDLISKKAQKRIQHVDGLDGFDDEFK